MLTHSLGEKDLETLLETSFLNNAARTFQIKIAIFSLPQITLKLPFFYKK